MTAASVPAPACPGASVLAGPPAAGPTVLCGPLRLLGLQQPVSQRPNDRFSVFQMRDDRRTVTAFCLASPAAPVRAGDGPRATCYTDCAIWREMKDREAAAREPQHVDDGVWGLIP